MLYSTRIVINLSEFSVLQPLLMSVPHIQYYTLVK